MRLRKHGFILTVAVTLVVGCSVNRPPEEAKAAAEAQVPEQPAEWTTTTFCNTVSSDSSP